MGNGEARIMACSITCSKRLEWDAAHRLLGHEGKCASLHGHRYAAIIECEATQLDDVGRVIDFSVIKEKVGHWIETHWDHTCILNREDVGLIEFLNVEAIRNNQQLPYVMSQPTAENMAIELLMHAQRLLSEDDVEVITVTVFETPTSSAKVIAAKVGGWVRNV